MSQATKSKGNTYTPFHSLSSFSLLPNPDPNWSRKQPSQTPSQILLTNRYLRYSIRILSSPVTPSIAADEAAVAESIKRQLVTQCGSSMDLRSKAKTLEYWTGLCRIRKSCPSGTTTGPAPIKPLVNTMKSFFKQKY